MAVTINSGSKAPGATGGADQPSFRSVADMNAFFSSPVSLNATGDTVRRYADEIEKMKSAGEMKDFKICIVDAQSANLITSVLVLTQKVKTKVLAYSMILGVKTDALQPNTFKNANNEILEIPVTSGDLYVDELIAKVKLVVGAAYPGVQESDILDVGGSVLPERLSQLTDRDFSDAVRKFVNRATNAVIHAANRGDAAAPYFNAAEFGKYNDFLAKPEFTDAPAHTAAGAPVRRQCSITLSAADRTRTRSVIGNSVVPMAQTSVYVDFLFTGQQPAPAPHLPAPTQLFQPLLVISNTQPLQDIVTPELQLLALSSVTLLARNKAWMSCYRPGYAGGASANPFHSVAGLGYEMGVEVKTDDQTAVFDFLQAATWSDQPAFVLHIEEAGELTWCLGMFEAASRGDTNAIAAIRAYADRLTNNNFSQNFPAGEEICRAMDDRVLLGDYIDNAGVERDLRDFNYHAFLNLVGSSDMAQAFEYQATFNPATGTLEARLAQRIKLLRNLAGDGVNITGYAIPVALNSKFLVALHKSIEACGLSIRTQGAYEFKTDTRFNTTLMSYGVNGMLLGGGIAGGHTSQLAPQVRAYGY